MGNMVADPQERFSEALALLFRLHMALDMADAEGFADCFVDAGIWHRGAAEVSGRQAILGIFADRPKDRVSLHAVSNLCLEADGSDFIARYFLTVSGSEGAQPARPIWILACQDRLVDTASGLRLISKQATPHLVFDH